MKFEQIALADDLAKVAPSHEGAWIEIVLLCIVLLGFSVAPSHEGAWIEI